MEIGYRANFDWNITKRKLVIFLPSFKYPKLTEFSISQIQTKVDPSKWIIIIGNDNVDIDWSYLKYRNVCYFTLLRNDKKSRNSCYIRNFAIKRSKSEFFLQKDAEVVVLGDFIHRVIDSQKPWRVGKIYALDKRQTERYLKTADVESTIGKYPTKFYNRGKHPAFAHYDAEIFEEIPLSNCMLINKEVGDSSVHMKNVVLGADGQINLSSYFQYAFGIKTEVLQSLKGYDEDYTSYGWEDTDLFCRLHAMNQHIIPDYSCAAVHPYHPRGSEHEEEMVVAMRKIFISKEPEKFQRNPDGWGEGF